MCVSGNSLNIWDLVLSLSDPRATLYSSALFCIERRLCSWAPRPASFLLGLANSRRPWWEIWRGRMGGRSWVWLLFLCLCGLPSMVGHLLDSFTRGWDPQAPASVSGPIPGNHPAGAHLWVTSLASFETQLLYQLNNHFLELFSLLWTTEVVSVVLVRS